ncbi:MAG: DUF4465 domain-containing protein [Alistipes sp.]|nr:DUF4465 domain-containing protein [Alistipes sp.]
MKKSLFLLAILLVATACQNEFEDNYTAATSAEELVIMGYSSAEESRTSFGNPTASEIPFLWSKGDCIWLGASKSEALEDDASLAYFSFKAGTGTVGDGHVFYNMTNYSEYAKVLATQSADGNLGNDGDFGYAKLDKYGTFYLSHKTAYLWFDTKSNDVDMPLLSSITLSTEGITIAGEREYDFLAGEGGKWTDKTSNPSSSVTLNFEGGKQLQSANEGVMAAMVLLPAKVGGTELTITYTFANGKIFTETKSPKNDFVVGGTQRIATTISKSDLKDPEPDHGGDDEANYTLRVLTFEDEDAKFEPHECEFYYAMLGQMDYVWIETWSDYIPRDGQYGNGHGSYEWYDEGNTELAFVKPTIDTWWGISGHAGISDYVGTDEDINNFADDNLLFQIDLQAYNVEGGANGSKNFCSQYGYLDPEEYATIYSPEGVLPGLQFMDGEARVIDHMFVTNTTYAYAIITRGECDFGGSYEYNDESTFKIVAYGYDSFDDTEPTTTEFYLLNTDKRIVTDWTEWDLSVLGEVVRVEFNLVACYEGYGRYGLVIPAYFAYDDVAVRFPIE